ncbi:DUF4838 domain-containing protein [bacterium]|nr:DUF4838 domain-containing protein [bacterium]
MKTLLILSLNVFKKLLPLCLIALGSVTAYAADLVIAENGKCDYQIVIPDKGKDSIVDHWLLMTAKLTQTAFEKNGFAVVVVEEGAKAKEKPCIYLGATRFAAKNGIDVEQHDDWTYYIKAVGKDLIVAGNDKQDPVKTIRGTQTPLALLGTVKGACDFLREYVGVRFLFQNMTKIQFVARSKDRGMFNEDGSLKVDTRSIAFTPVSKIATPADLDLTKTPMMRASYGAANETFYHIANNFFPLTSFVEGSKVKWYEAVPVDKYGKTNPEYFSLDKNGKRSCDLPIPTRLAALPICVANKGVQDLMGKAIEKLIKNGEKTISIATQDGFGLCRCHCEDCNKLFGMEAGDLKRIRARGKSGKLWQGFFNITERFREKHPEVKFVILNYGQDTPISSDAEICRKALDLFAKAKAAAPPEGVYGQRIALVDEFLIPLRDRSTQMNVKRPEGLPEYRVIDMGKDKWRDAQDTLKLDGKLDEAFWIAYHHPRPLSDVSSAKKPKLHTRFQARWMNGHLYFGIRCELPKGETPVIGSRENNDPTIWQGEHLELLIETDKHSYYQIAINPAGAMVNIDRGVSKSNWYDWSAQAEVATHLGEDFWSVELKLPVTSSEEDPLHQIVGSRPFQSKRAALESGKGTSLPWYFNLYRKRAGADEAETTSFSPLGPDNKTFHVPLRFAKIYVQ